MTLVICKCRAFQIHSYSMNLFNIDIAPVYFTNKLHYSTHYKLGFACKMSEHMFCEHSIITDTGVKHDFWFCLRNNFVWYIFQPHMLECHYSLCTRYRSGLGMGMGEGNCLQTPHTAGFTPNPIYMQTNNSLQRINCCVTFAFHLVPVFYKRASVWQRYKWSHLMHFVSDSIMN